MHRIDADSHVTNLFNPGDPLVPRAATQVDHHWLNAVQEELANAITAAGVALVKGTNTQLRDAVVNVLTAQTIDGIKTWAKRAIYSVAHNGFGNEVLRIINSGTAPGLHIETAGEVAVVLSNGKAIRHGVFSTSNAFPAAPEAGDVVYMAGTLNKLYCYDGTTWNACW